VHSGAIPRAARDAWWRYAVLALIVAGSLIALLSWPVIRQDTGYHGLADRRTFLGVPNVGDVASNLAFLLVGIAGLVLCVRRRIDGARGAWIVFFAGIALVAVGSAYYHWAPRDGTLVWDRLPMTIALMGLFVALLAEHLGLVWERRLLVPAVLVGLASVVYWAHSGDLRPYVWVQGIPLLAIPVVAILFRGGLGGTWYLLAGLVCYVIAKVCELYDQRIFSLTGEAISGHTLKHLLAALACFAVYLMLADRARARDSLADRG
jgi:uncharacterized membrane protein YhaH (DUF805 family)